MARGWLTAPLVGDGQPFPLDKAGEPIIAADRGPFRAAVIDRHLKGECAEGDRFECLIGKDFCLVAYDVEDDSDLEDHGGESLLAEADLDKTADKVAEPEKLAALAIDAEIGAEKGATAKDILRQIGQNIEPTFDPDEHLGEADAPPTGSFLEDTFSDVNNTLIHNHTGEKGATWVNGVAGEEPRISGNFLVQQSTNYQYAYASGEPASADYSVESGVKRETGVKAERITGPIGRCSTIADTSYQFGWETGNGYVLLVVVAGIKTILGTYARTVTEPTEDKALLSMTGTAIKGFVNGTERISATDALISTAGKAGVRVQGSPTIGAKINYVTATDAKIIVYLEASLSGQGSLSADLRALATLAADLEGQGSLSADLRALATLAADLEGQGSLSADLRALATLAADLEGQGSLSADLRALATLAADLEGQGSLSADLRALATLAADLEGQGSLSADLRALATLAADLEGQGSLEVDIRLLAQIIRAGSATAGAEAVGTGQSAASPMGSGVIGHNGD